MEYDVSAMVLKDLKHDGNWQNQAASYGGTEVFQELSAFITMHKLSTIRARRRCARLMMYWDSGLTIH